MTQKSSTLDDVEGSLRFSDIGGTVGPRAVATAGLLVSLLDIVVF